MTVQPIFDAGLQPERTALAWRRTALAVAVGSIVAFRVLPDAFQNLWWCVPGGGGVLCAGWMWWISHRRHRAFVRQIGVALGEPRTAGGAALAAVVTFLVVIGIVAVVAVVLGRQHNG